MREDRRRLRGPSCRGTRHASTQGRARCVSEGTRCGPRASRLRVLELTYTAWDLEPLAMDCGFDGPPFRWDEDRRFLIRAELDAAFFHLYLPADASGDWIPARKANGCPRDETPLQLEELKQSFPRPKDGVDYIMDTFPIVKRKDEEKYGTYRTKEMSLQIYDEMQESIRTGKEYQTKLSPEPGSRECCHPGRAEKPH